jgi:hypothetical protein
MQVSVDRRIIALKVEQDFDVDQNVRDNERRKPEMSRATGFDDQPRGEVKWGKRNWASSMTIRSDRTTVWDSRRRMLQHQAAVHRI